MAQPDDYRTLKPSEGVDERYATLAPPKKAAPPPPPKRPAPRPAPPPAEAAQPAAAPPAPKPAARPPAEAIRLAAKLARPFCRQFPLSAEAGRLLDEKQTVLVYLYRLMNERLFLDAVRLLAHALPPREGIRWACDCAKGSAASAALAAAEAWLADPCEPNRRACGEAAAAAGCATAAGSAALAVFLSGGSIAPADRPAVPPAEHLASRAVANAVILAAVGGEPGNADERYFQYLKARIALATGAGR